MSSIFLVRHGEAQYELAEERRLIGGMRDLVPLTARGRAQSELAARELASYGIRKIIASPMTRTMETAHILSSRLLVPLAVEFDLHEWLPDLRCSYDNRAFVSTQTEEMQKHGGEWPIDNPRSWEPLSRVRHRVLAALGKHATEAPLAVAIHGTVIYALTGQHVGNCQIVEYHLKQTD